MRNPISKQIADEQETEFFTNDRKELLITILVGATLVCVSGILSAYLSINTQPAPLNSDGFTQYFDGKDAGPRLDPMKTIRNMKPFPTRCDLMGTIRDMTPLATPTSSIRTS